MDFADDWRFKTETTDPTDPGLDVQAVETHEIGHWIGLAHTIMGFVISSSSPDQPGSDDDATMVPSIDNTTNLRDLRFDDKASAIRTYTRNNGLAQNPAGLTRVTGRIMRDPQAGDPAGPACSVPATGVSVRANPIPGGSFSSNPFEFEDMSFAMGPMCKPKPESVGSRCTNGKDDDCDGLVDCDDVDDCGGNPSCSGGCETTETSCVDGVDNDCNGDTDCGDAACIADPACPASCNNNGACESGENCSSCFNDCPPGDSCGNGICEPGEDCTGCSDCRGKQNGKPANRYCCSGDIGGAGGEGPVDCSDARCTNGGFACVDDLTCSAFCGDGTCDAGEDPCNCASDCGAPPGTETNCSDGVDNDCDGQTDGSDPDCAPPCDPTETDCSDGIDNDCNGDTDCGDAACIADPACASPFAPDGVDTLSYSEYRPIDAPLTPDGSFVLNLPPGDDYRVDVFLYNWFGNTSPFYSARYNFTTINSNTVNLSCGVGGALFFPAEATVTTLSPGQVVDLGDICVQSTICVIGDPTTTGPDYKPAE